MKLNSIQVAGLKALAAVPVRAEPLAVVEDPKLQPAAQAAYNLGKVDGRAELARELLQAEADANGQAPAYVNDPDDWGGKGGPDYVRLG